MALRAARLFAVAIRTCLVNWRAILRPAIALSAVTFTVTAGFGQPPQSAQPSPAQTTPVTTTGPAATAAPRANQPSPQQEPAPIVVRVNEVIVPVTVTDDKTGRLVSNLDQQDFQIFDQGK